jgi:hypothetical protein
MSTPTTAAVPAARPNRLLPAPQHLRRESVYSLEFCGSACCWALLRR